MTMFHWPTIAIVNAHETLGLLGVSFLTVHIRTLCLSYVCVKFNTYSPPVQTPQEPHRGFGERMVDLRASRSA